MIDLLESHARLWERIQPALIKKRLPQAFLFVGPRHAGILQFANRLMAVLICQSEGVVPCGHCRACHLLTHAIHPDINYIRQETPGSAIKIEQVRDLQQDIYQTPQRGTHRFIVIDPADKMNNSAANALLKVLEEPPSHTTFILIAEQVSSMPATILSRCQKYIFPSSDVSTAIESADYLAIGTCYPAESSRAELVKQNITIITALCELIEEKTSPCTIAARWSSFMFDDILWLLYLVTAEAINYQLIEVERVSPENEHLKHFSSLVSPARLFHQLDKINAIMRKINHNVNMNQTLVLEDLLLGY